MSHNANQVLMGATRSNVKEVTSRKGSIAAGTGVRLKSDDTLSTAKADGSLLGISLGVDLSSTDKTAICRKGLGVPLLLKASFNPTVGAIVELDDSTGLGTGDGSKTAVNAVYVTGRLADGGIGEDGLTKGVAIIDFPGGL